MLAQTEVFFAKLTIFSNQKFLRYGKKSPEKDTEINREMGRERQIKMERQRKIERGERVRESEEEKERERERKREGERERE